MKYILDVFLLLWLSYSQIIGYVEIGKSKYDKRTEFEWEGLRSEFPAYQKRNSKDKQNSFIDLSQAFEQNLKNVIATLCKPFAY